MSEPTTSIAFSLSTPAAPAGDQDIVFQSDGGTPQQKISGYPQKATSLLRGTVIPDGTTIAIDGTGKISATKTLTALGFVLNTGATGTDVGPLMNAPAAGSFTQCVVTTKLSDPAIALTFTIRQNGTAIFTSSPSIAAATASGTVSTFTTLTTSPLPVAKGDIFSIDITSGSATWQATVQLE